LNGLFSIGAEVVAVEVDEVVVLDGPRRRVAVELVPHRLGDRPGA
jgi:hypothetical protein